MIPSMSIFGLVRPVSLGSGVLACALVVVAQAAQPDPDRFVASIYVNGREATVWAEWLDGARRRE
jgi:hypothetical protein